MIEADRVRLRAWTEADRPTFHAHCADPEVMRYFPALLSAAEADAAIDRQRGFADSHGYCFWVVELRDRPGMIGFCGLKPGADATPLAGSVEIGWRFGRAWWGQGLAGEAARASLDWGFANLPVDRIGAITSIGNVASRRLMERLGMERDLMADFDHPAVPAGHPARRCLTSWKRRA